MSENEKFQSTTFFVFCRDFREINERVGRHLKSAAGGKIWIIRFKSNGVKWGRFYDSGPHEYIGAHNKLNKEIITFNLCRCDVIWTSAEFHSQKCCSKFFGLKKLPKWLQRLIGVSRVFCYAKSLFGHVKVACNDDGWPCAGSCTGSRYTKRQEARNGLRIGSSRLILLPKDWRRA